MMDWGNKAGKGRQPQKLPLSSSYLCGLLELYLHWGNLAGICSYANTYVSELSSKGVMKLVFIHYSVGHWLRAAGFGECKFSAFPGLPK